MAFNIEKFDIVKQNHDKTSLCFYRGLTLETPDNLATVIASGYFNEMANVLGTGSVIIISAADGAGVYQVTNTDGVITVTEADPA